MEVIKNTEFMDLTRINNTIINFNNLTDELKRVGNKFKLDIKEIVEYYFVIIQFFKDINEFSRKINRCTKNDLMSLIEVIGSKLTEQLTRIRYFYKIMDRYDIIEEILGSNIGIWLFYNETVLMYNDKIYNGCVFGLDKQLTVIEFYGRTISDSKFIFNLDIYIDYSALINFFFYEKNSRI